MSTRNTVINEELGSSATPSAAAADEHTVMLGNAVEQPAPKPVETGTPMPESRAVAAAREEAERNPKRRYAALVGFGAVQIPGNKQDRDEHHSKLLREIVRYWDSTVPVAPYWDKFADVDGMYHRIITHGGAIRNSSVNIDDPCDVMNKYGNPLGKFYYRTIPEDDRRLREAIRSEYERICEDAENNGTIVPPEVQQKYAAALEEPKPAPRTGLYAYSRVNPNGMFRAYDYPIKHAFNDISAETSRLVHRAYGTYHDIMQIQHLDTEATAMPLVAFRSDGEMLEIDAGDDPQILKDFLLETLAPSDYVALIECYL